MTSFVPDSPVFSILQFFQPLGLKNKNVTKVLKNGHLDSLFKGRPELLEKEIHEILGSKREDRFSDPFFDSVQNTSLVRFSYLLRLRNFCQAPQDMRKFPQKCQKIAGC